MIETCTQPWNRLASVKFVVLGLRDQPGADDYFSDDSSGDRQVGRPWVVGLQFDQYLSFLSLSGLLNRNQPEIVFDMTVLGGMQDGLDRIDYSGQIEAFETLSDSIRYEWVMPDKDLETEWFCLDAIDEWWVAVCPDERAREKTTLTGDWESVRWVRN